jgi:hypothetical protein
MCKITAIICAALLSGLVSSQALAGSGNGNGNAGNPKLNGNFRH